MESMEISDGDINLSNEYATLLDKTVKESSTFRQEIKERDEETRKLLKDLSNRVDILCGRATEPSGSSQAIKRTAPARTVVPRRCRVCIF